LHRPAAAAYNPAVPFPFQTLAKPNLPAADPTTQDLPDSPGPDEPDSSAPEPEPEPIAVEAVYHADPTGHDLVGWLDVELRRAVELAGVTYAQLSIAVVDDDEMAQLHEQYTGVSGTTDVLTFDLSEQQGADLTSIDGDIVICLDEAQRQAKERGHATRHELLLYAVHGLMHLLGEDDHDESDYERMHAREDDLLQRMGIGPLFDPDRKPTDPQP